SVLICCLCFLLSACGSTIVALPLDGTATPGGTSVSSTVTVSPTVTATLPGQASGCGNASPVKAGTTEQEAVPVDPQVSQGATTRTYLLHVPVDYQPQLPLPLLLIFHGRGSNAAEIEGYSGFSQLADRERFIAVYPQGLPNADGEAFWDSFVPATAGIDEVAFVNIVLNDVEQKLCVDTRRIDATGFSNGGNMTGMLACQLANRIAAFAPIAGNFFDFKQGCHPGRAVALLNSHGTADDVVPYNGDNGRYGVQDWLEQWAELDGCAADPITFSQVSKVVAMQWTDCQEDVAIFHYRVLDEKHTWPKTLGNFPTDETIWRFFLAYSLPPTVQPH
ncbi:MAG TPA: PHB depolymerase family esterase, partial [Ktedonobacteraceae bacterium]|nr:PHB depolymerase family esterase [Ktedonobacteraceae bacterium]